MKFTWTKQIVEWLDWPSGSIVGLFTLIFMGMCVDAYARTRGIPTEVVEGYKFVVLTFAGSKAVKTVWGKKDADPPKQ